MSHYEPMLMAYGYTHFVPNVYLRRKMSISSSITLSRFNIVPLKEIFNKEKVLI